jgi:spore coat protein U-like protein
MSAFRRLFAATAAPALLLLLPAAARGAPVPATTNSGGKAVVLKSLSVLKQADLDFGELVVASAGTAVVNPVTGTLTTTGTITKIGTTAHPATFTATGSKNSVVNIRLPAAAITLTRVGGGGTMTVSNWTLDGKSNRKIPLNSAFNFNVGATLNVGTNQADGTYAGTFTITVQYP